MTTCTNCGHSLSEPAKYCDQCGQSIVTFQKPIKPVLTDMLHESLDIDGRMLLTLKTLFTKPGMLSFEYRNGRRMKYTPPLRMYLVISILFFLLLSLLESEKYILSDNLSSNSDYYPKIMFVLLPVFALILQLLFKGTFYLANLIFAIHMHCFSYLIFMLMFPMEAYEKAYPFLLIPQLPLFLYLMVYFALALKRYYQQDWPKTLIKFLALFLFYIGILGISFDVILGQTLGQ